MTLVSICLASYNGADYISAQIYSIQRACDYLSSRDTTYLFELLVYDDCSTDQTVAIVSNLNLPCLRVIKGSRSIGHVRSFEFLISLAKGDLIFLSDQDDIWPADRLFLMVSSFTQDVQALFGDFLAFSNYQERCLPPLRSLRMNPAPVSKLSITNILSIATGTSVHQYGSCCGFTASMSKALLPFPFFCKQHDKWISFVGSLSGMLYYLPTVVTFRRLHSNNLTSHSRPLLAKVLTRINFTLLFFFASARVISRLVHRSL